MFVIFSAKACAGQWMQLACPQRSSTAPQACPLGARVNRPLYIHFKQGINVHNSAQRWRVPDGDWSVTEWRVTNGGRKGTDGSLTVIRPEAPN